jgi:N-acetyl sugar amidotransferase
MKICKRCIQPDTRPGIFFNDHGICGACLWEEEKLSIDWKLREEELKKKVDWAKGHNQIYDCVIGISGGKDSTKQALTAKDRFGLRCLLVNSEPENITDLGRKNIENLKNLGFDIISIRPNPLTMKKLIKKDFFEHLNPAKITEFSLWASTYIIAEKFNIPLIIQGENSALTLGVSLTGQSEDDNALNVDMQNTLKSGWQEYLKDDITEKDLFLFHYDKKILEKKGIRAIWIQYYLKEWSQYENAEFSKKYGFKWRDEYFDRDSIGTYCPYFQLDSDLTQVNQMHKFVKFGFGQCMDHVCYDIRDGRMSRKEGIELVKKFDGKCGKNYIQKFIDYIQISSKEYWDVVNSFRGETWIKKENGEWHNKIWDLLDSEYKNL